LKKNSSNCKRSAARFFVFALVFCALPVFAQRAAKDPWWFTMEQGKRFFRNGEYGEALRCFETAREERKTKYAGFERELITVLSIHTVRLFKDDLGLVEAYIEKERRTTAATALEELYYRVPRNSLGNSASKALEELGRLKEYPDAEYWIGEAYRAEGEYGIALKQYQKALDRQELLETPGFGTELLYKMADIYRLRREYTLMEEKLLAILGKDNSWNRESFARSAMLNSAANNGLDRFLVLYRNNNAGLEKAHRLLGLYYYVSGRHNRAAEHLLFSFLIQNTVVIERIRQDRYNYVFSTLDQLARDIAASERNTRRVLEEYMASSEYYRVMFYLANAFYGDGKQRSARGIWDFLAGQGAGEWSVRARNQLRQPEIEPLRRELTNLPSAL
jgi:tetratricopeptide (TPR) repeat protein